MAEKHVGPGENILAMIDQHDDEEAKAIDKKAKNVGETVAKGSKLVEAAKEMVSLNEQIDTLEAELKDLKARRDHLRQATIPEMMRAAGIVDSKGKGSFTIPGRKIYLETRTFASVTEGNTPEFHAWLKKNNEDGIMKMTIHNSTLVSWVKERRENGKQVPPTVSVHEVTVAKAAKA